MKTVELRIAKQGPTFEDVQALAKSRKYSSALGACDKYLRGAAEQAAQNRRMVGGGKGKKNKGQLLAMAAAGFADKGKQRAELPKFLRDGPSITDSSAKPVAGFTPGTIQWSRIYARQEVNDDDD